MASKKTQQSRREKNTIPLKAVQEEDEEPTLRHASMAASATDAGHANPAQNSDQVSVILAAINSLKADGNSRHDEVLNAIQGIKRDLGEFAGRLDAAENRISTTEDAVATLEYRLDKTQKIVEELSTKCLDLECRSRRSNMIIVGLSESATEGTDSIPKFLEKWIPQMIGAPECYLTPLSIERAHRLGKPRETASAKPRPLILKFLNHRDKVKVMNMARDKGKMMHGTHQIMFFHDHPQSLQEKRKKYDAVKKNLRARGIKDFGIIHPARLLLTHEGQRHVFDSPTAAERFVNNLPRVSTG